jgi:hypothetical protein
MRPSLPVLVLVGVFFGIGVLVLVAFAVEGGLTPLLLVPIGVLAAGYALMIGGFKLESRRSREALVAVVAGSGGASAYAPLPPEEWLEFRWADVRVVGVVGFAWLGLFAVAGTLFLYDWLVRRPGCKRYERNDPAYVCPSGARVFTVWGIGFVAMLAALIGIWLTRQRRVRWLVVIVLVEAAATVALAWIAGDPAFHRHRR